MSEIAKAFVSAVIYVRNNESTLPEFMGVIAETLKENFSSAEIICVDDASTDKSVESIEAIGSNDDMNVTVVRMSYFHGRELAIRAGDDIAIGDYVLEFDNAILDFDPSLIRDVYERVVAGFDIVGATPRGRRKITSRLFYRMLNSSLKATTDLDTETFRMLSRRALNRVENTSQTIPYRKALYASAGLLQASIEHELYGAKIHAASERPQRERKYRLDVAVEAMVLFTRTGYKIALGLALFMMAVALFMVVYSIGCFAAGITVAGWTTTVLFLSFAFFGLFGILAIVIKYLQIIVNLIFKKTPYTYRSIERY